MQEHNMQNIVSASKVYLSTCLAGPYDHEAGFSSLSKNKTFEFKGESDLDNIITHNWLLNKQMLFEVQSILEKEEGLLALIRQAPNALGLTVAKEIVYVIYYIYSKKVNAFKQLLKANELFLPKMQCFIDGWD